MCNGEKPNQISKPRATAIEVSGVSASVAPAPIAIGKGRIGQLYKGKLRVWHVGNWKVPELELGTGLRGVTALADGSLAVVGADSACVLRPGAQALTCDKILGMLLPEGRARVWGAPDGSLAIFEDTMVSQLHLTGKEAMLDRSIILAKSPLQAALAGASTVAWADSSSVKTTSLTGAQTEWSPEPAATPLHLAPVRDGVWVSLSDHRVLLVSGAKVVHALPVGLRVISISADDKHIAVLTFDDIHKRLHLSLFEPVGRIWSADLAPPTPPFFDKEPYVILSPFEPIVVVGSAATLQILDRASGKQLGEAG